MNIVWTLFCFIFVIVFCFAVAKWRTAALRKKGIYPKIGSATMADVENLARAGHRILAIRVYREIHTVSLREARKAVAKLGASSNH